MTRNLYGNLLIAKSRGKENAYFFAVLWEVKQWKSLTH